MLKVFCGGSRIIPGFNQGLSEDVIEIINQYVRANAAILIGDADGVDSLIQEYLFKIGYKNVVIFYSTAKPRNMKDNKWQLKYINARGLKGREFMQAKDKAMAALCDEALMIWDPVSINNYGRLAVSKGTLANCTNVLTLNKPVTLWSTAQCHAIKSADLGGLENWMKDLRPYDNNGEKYKAMMIQEFQRQKNTSIRWASSLG